MSFFALSTPNASKAGNTIPFFHWNFFQLLVWLGAFHFPDAHSIDLGGVINSLLSGDVTVIALNNRETWGSGAGLQGSRREGGTVQCYMVFGGTPPSSSASVSDSSLSTNLLSWVPTNSRVQIIKAVSAPPTVSSTESLCSHLTLVTCALCPTYFLNFACWPCKARNWQLTHLESHYPLSGLFHPCCFLQWLLLDAN